MGQANGAVIVALQRGGRRAPILIHGRDPGVTWLVAAGDAGVGGVATRPPNGSTSVRAKKRSQCILASHRGATRRLGISERVVWVRANEGAEASPGGQALTSRSRRKDSDGAQGIRPDQDLDINSICGTGLQRLSRVFLKHSARNDAISDRLGDLAANCDYFPNRYTCGGRIDRERDSGAVGGP